MENRRMVRGYSTRGLYKIEVEIPAGKWTITTTPKAAMAQAEIESKLDNTGMGISWSGAYETNYLYGKESWAYNESKMNSWDVTLTERKQFNPSSEISVLHSEP